MPERIVGPGDQPEDQSLDLSLRPRWLAEYIGQDKVKANLRIAIEAAKARGEGGGYPRLSVHCVCSYSRIACQVTCIILLPLWSVKLLHYKFYIAVASLVTKGF